MDTTTLFAVVVAVIVVVAAVVVFTRRSPPAATSKSTGAAAVAASSKKVDVTSSSVPAEKSSSVESRAVATANGGSAHAAEDHRPSVDIYYGSQTGTAENFAKGLAKEARTKGLTATAIDVARFNAERLEKGGVALFLMATYGEGDPTDNAVEFMRYLDNAAKAGTAARDASGTGGAAANGAESGGPLHTLRFGVFGLGNKQYEHFNAQGRRTNALLEAAGGTRVHPYRDGDDDGSMDDDFAAWKAQLWEHVHAASRSGAADDATSSMSSASATGSMSSASATGSTTPVPDADAPFRVEMLPPAADGTAPPRELDVTPADIAAAEAFKAFPATVAANVELRKVARVGDSTRHIELTLPDGRSYETADNLYVCPRNASHAVATVAEACSLVHTLDAHFRIVPVAAGDKSRPFPCPATVRDLLSRYLDLHSAPRRELLAALAPLATRAADADALRRAAEDTDAYHAAVTTPRLAAFELFRAFPSLRLSLQDLVTLWPRLHARAYTISSSARVSPRTVSITVSVIDAPAPDATWARDRRTRGVASSYLSELRVGDEVHVFVRESGFRLPVTPSTPVVCVGPGTGFAPIRAFLQERAARRAAGENVGDTVVFFGCRSRDEDFIYEDETVAHARSGTATSLHLAFSRETAGRKVYVQHLMAEPTVASSLCDLLQRGAHVYVCGGTSMGAQVLETFRERVLPTRMSKEQAAEFLHKLQHDKPRRYIQELWSSAGSA